MVPKESPSSSSIRGVDHAQTDYVSKKEAFSYVRPLFGNGYNEKNSFTKREKYFQDESGFVENGYMGQRDSYLLEQSLSQATLANYVRYKFILYDQTSFIHQNNVDWERVRRVVSFEDPSALIWDQSGMALPKRNEPAVPIILKEPSSDFKVVGFDVNSITLSIHLDRRKFLVFNDSFHSGWHALIDHHPVRLYQANIGRTIRDKIRIFSEVVMYRNRWHIKHGVQLVNQARRLPKAVKRIDQNDKADGGAHDGKLVGPTGQAVFYAGRFSFQTEPMTPSPRAME